jgi:hypothetical protein
MYEWIKHKIRLYFVFVFNSRQVFYLCRSIQTTTEVKYFFFLIRALGKLLSLFRINVEMKNKIRKRIKLCFLS